MKFRFDESGAFFEALGEGDRREELLREFVENDMARRFGAEVAMDHEEISRRSRSERDCLGLPRRYPYAIRLDAEGELAREGFRFVLRFAVGGMGELLPLERCGVFLVNKDSPSSVQYVLSHEQYLLCEAIRGFEGAEARGRSQQDREIAYARVKQLALAAGAIMHPYLLKTDVYVPENVKLDLSKGEDGDVTVQPRIDDPSDEAFRKKFERYPRARDVYTVSDAEGNRRRIPIPKKLKPELEKARDFHRLPVEKRQEILEHPEEHFDPDVLDLDFFSRRVVELGLYKPKFYPFISPYRSEWLPGFLVESADGERERVPIKTMAEVEQIEASLEKAEAEGSSTVAWKGRDIPVADAKRVAAVARAQLSNPKEPQTVALEESEGTKVLIIKENIDDVEYSEVQEAAPEERELLLEDPPHLRPGVRLLDHQKEGVAWLQSLVRSGYSGALLADDMGLGKTIQVLSFIEWYAEKLEAERPHMVVAPVSLLQNWEREYEKFFENRALEVVVLHGPRANVIMQGSPKDAIARLTGRKLVLTNYETLRSRQRVLCAIDWASVALDEAQKIKTPGTLVTNAAKALKADFRIASTGTPVENTIMDLWCIVDFLVPGLLGGAKAFAATYQTPLGKPDTDVAALGEQVRQSVGNHLRRRLKKDVLDDLPPKEVISLPREMPPIQANKYTSMLRQLAETRGDGSMDVLQAIYVMQKLVDHPYVGCDFESLEHDQLINASAKLQVTTEILDAVRERGEKVILFSHLKEVQRILRHAFEKRYGRKISVITGETPARSTGQRGGGSRQELIDEFQAASGFNLIIMSPLAAGVGLNVTGANNVVHYTRHWNPAKEDQATDRVYRIGQERRVNVYIPMSVSPEFDSFDVVIDGMLMRKRNLAEATLFPSERAEISQDELLGSVLRGVEKIGERTDGRLVWDQILQLEGSRFDLALALLWFRRNDAYELVRVDPGRRILLREKATGRSHCLVPWRERPDPTVLAQEGRLCTEEFGDGMVSFLLAWDADETERMAVGRGGIALFDRRELVALSEQSELESAEIESALIRFGLSEDLGMENALPPTRFEGNHTENVLNAN